MYIRGLVKIYLFCYKRSTECIKLQNVSLIEKNKLHS